MSRAETPQCDSGDSDSEDDIPLTGDLDALAQHRARKWAIKNPKKGGESQDDYITRVQLLIRKGLESQATRTLLKSDDAATAELAAKKEAGEDFQTRMRAALRKEFNRQGGAKDVRPHSIIEHRVQHGAREYKVKYYAKGYEMPPPAWKSADYCLQYEGLVEDYMAVSHMPLCPMLLSF